MQPAIGAGCTPPNHTFLHSDFGMQKRGLGDSVLQDHVHRIDAVGTTQIARCENRLDRGFRCSLRYPPAACNAVQFAQSPKTSTTCAAPVNPCSAAIAFAHASTSSAAISTVSPQLRQMR
jgi:hypothetical protein